MATHEETSATIRVGIGDVPGLDPAELNDTTEVAADQLHRHVGQRL